MNPDAHPAKPKGRNRLVSFLIVVVIASAVVGYKFYQKSSTGSRVKADLIAYVHDAPLGPDELAFFDAGVESCHGKIFDSCYQIGGRHSSSRFDHEKYVHGVMQSVAMAARNDGRGELAEKLSILDASIELVAADGK